eukprot:gene25545-34102_t
MRSIFQQNLEEYIPTGPAESGKLGRYAEEQLIEARRIGDKASFLKAMDSINREVIGLPDRLSKKVGNSQTDHSRSNESSLSPLSRDFDRMRDASNSSLDMLKGLRQDLLSIQMSGKSNSMAPNDLEFNFDKKVHFRPPNPSNSNRHEQMRDGSIIEGPIKSLPQQYLPPKLQSTSKDKSFQKTTNSRETLRPVDTRTRVDSQINNYSLTEDDDNDDDDDEEEDEEEEEEEEEEESSVSSGKISNSSSIQHRNADPIPPLPPPRRDAEEGSSMIQELRSLVVEMKENSLSSAPATIESEVSKKAAKRVPDKPLAMSAAGGAASLDSNTPDSEYVPTVPLVSTSKDSSLTPSIHDLDDEIGADTTTPPPPPVDVSTHPILPFSHSDSPLTSENIISPTFASLLMDDSDMPTALEPVKRRSLSSSSSSSSQPPTEPPPPAAMVVNAAPKSVIPQKRRQPPPQAAVPAASADEVDLSGTWISSQSAPHASAKSSSPNTHIHIHNHLAPSTSTQPLAPQQRQQQRQPVATGSNWTVQRVDEFGKVRPYQPPQSPAVERVDDPYGRRRGKVPPSNRSTEEDAIRDSDSVDLSGLSLQAEAMSVLGVIRKTLSPSAQRKMDILTLNDLSSFEFQSLDTLTAASKSLPPKKKIPTIAILGHFNHGKTTLLDAFCNTDLVSTELHGITQIIRTRLVNFSSNPATAADSGGEGSDLNVGPQTQESIGLLESLKIPAIVCINKIDLPIVKKSSTRVSELEQQLRSFVALENSIIIPISAKEKINLDAVIAAIYDLSAKVAKQNEGKVYTRTPMETYPGLDPRDFDDKRDVGLKCFGGIFISGYGTVMDTWNNRKGGTVLHAIVKHGQVRVGDYFSAGGWSGKIRAILHDYDKSIPIAYSGYAGCFSVSTHADISDPRPLGDRIYFLSNGQNKEDAQVVPALVKKMAPILVDKGAKALAEHIMQQQQMELALGSFAISQEVAEDYWLPKLEDRMRGFKKSPFFALGDGQEKGKGKGKKVKGNQKGNEKGKGKDKGKGKGKGKGHEKKLQVEEVEEDNDEDDDDEEEEEKAVDTEGTDGEDDLDGYDDEDNEGEVEEGDDDNDDDVLEGYEEAENKITSKSGRPNRGSADTDVDSNLPNVIVKADT